jgi:autotransporter-associated beta strand protein
MKRNNTTITCASHRSIRAFRPRLIALALFITGHVAIPPTRAATFHGQSGVDRNWSTPTNWTGNVLPTSGSPNLEVILSAGGISPFTSNQDLESPFVLQHLTVGYGVPPQVLNGSPLAFSNLGQAPSIRSNDHLGPPLTVNNDIILNADLTVSPPGAIPSVYQYFLNGAISGAGGLRQDRGGQVFLGGTAANSYAGSTILNDGELYLNKPDSIVAIPGDLVINSGGSMRSLRGSVIVESDAQIAADATVTLNVGLLSIKGGDQTLANVNFIGVDVPTPLYINGGEIHISPGRTLTIIGGITRASVLTPFFPRPITSLISGGTLDLGGGMRRFHVDDLNPIWLPTTLTVSSLIANGGIEKTGPGVLHLREAKNTFTGDVLVNEGLLSMGQGAELLFKPRNAGVSNHIYGTGRVAFDGIFKIDASAVTEASGAWHLLDVANLNETFGDGFRVQMVSGQRFSHQGRGVYQQGRWTFSTANGYLTLAPIPEPASAIFGLMPLLLARALPGDTRRQAKRSGSSRHMPHSRFSAPAARSAPALLRRRPNAGRPFPAACRRT